MQCQKEKKRKKYFPGIRFDSFFVSVNFRNPPVLYGLYWLSPGFIIKWVIIGLKYFHSFLQSSWPMHGLNGGIWQIHGFCIIWFNHKVCAPRIIKPILHDSYTYIRWQLRTRCVHMKEIGYFDLSKAFSYTKKESSNPIFLKEMPFLLHMCATCSELPTFHFILSQNRSY